MEPEDGRLFNRDWSLGNNKQRLHPRHIDQRLEEERRHQMRWLALLLEASGARPHESCGGVESSLRWGDVRIESLRMDNGKYVVLAHLSIRTLPKQDAAPSLPMQAGFLAKSRMVRSFKVSTTSSLLRRQVRTGVSQQISTLFAVISVALSWTRQKSLAFPPLFIPFVTAG